jgi:hypothetical protein
MVAVQKVIHAIDVTAGNLARRQKIVSDKEAKKLAKEGKGDKDKKKGDKNDDEEEEEVNYTFARCGAFVFTFQPVYVIGRGPGRSSDEH